MSVRIHFDKPYGGDESVVGKVKPVPEQQAKIIIDLGIGHVAGSAEDAKKKRAAENDAAVKRNAEKAKRAAEFAQNGDPKPESKKDRKARKKAERKEAEAAAAKK